MNAPYLPLFKEVWESTLFRRKLHGRWRCKDKGMQLAFPQALAYISSFRVYCN